MFEVIESSLENNKAAALDDENVLRNKISGYFITGTNTGVGKTYIATQLLLFLQQQGKKVMALKPVASGCEQTACGLRNEDALLLQQHANLKLSYTDINPFAFAEPIAPHIAATKAGVELSVAKLLKHCHEVCQQVTAKQAQSINACIVEGAGGWLVPLNARETMADFAVALGLPVILVVKIELGCINHTLLTIESIVNKGVTLAGWVANCLTPDTLAIEQNISSLQQRIKQPLLAKVGMGEQVDFSGLFAV